MSAQQKAYGGTQRKLVIAFDVGTTYSGISYCILDPGQTPIIKPVTKFPAQETVSGASKIPTIIYYDKEGNVKALGAEATTDGMYEMALESEWHKAEWFKLHLKPGLEMHHPNLSPLPPNKSVVDMFSDFFRYLLQCVASYIKDTHANGPTLWMSLEDNLHFVLCHPNGWEGKEQSQLRQAAVKSGLIFDTPPGHAKLVFVTEGEASLHFTIENGLLSPGMENEGVIIVDAGGGTIDVSAYRRVRQVDQKIFEEISTPESHFHGSVFVTLNAKSHFRDLLKASTYVGDLDHIAECFDKTTKPRFRNANDAQYVKFGSTRDDDPNCGIRFGQLKLAGTDVAKFFQPSVDCITEAVVNQKRLINSKISHVILVGGFGTNDWLFEQLKTVLKKKGFAVMRSESHVNKAVSDGAISFYLNHYVRARITKFTYGCMVSVPFVESNPEHAQRASRKFIDDDGVPMLPDGFRTILEKNSRISETKEFTRRLTSFFNETDKKCCLETTLVCYRGTQKNPQWADLEPDLFTRVCTLVADVSQLPKDIRTSKDGGKYYSVTFDVVVSFGLTELQAHLRWREKGKERRCPAKLVYDTV